LRRCRDPGRRPHRGAPIMNLQTWGVSLAVFLPVVGALVLTALPKEWGTTNRAHVVAGLFTAAPLAIVALMATQFDYHSGRMQFEVNVSWIPTIGARYHVGVDGVSFGLFLL